MLLSDDLIKFPVGHYGCYSLTLVTMFSQCLWKARELSMWNPSIYGLGLRQ